MGSGASLLCSREGFSDGRPASAHESFRSASTGLNFSRAVLVFQQIPASRRISGTKRLNAARTADHILARFLRQSTRKSKTRSKLIASPFVTIGATDANAGAAHSGQERPPAFVLFSKSPTWMAEGPSLPWRSGPTFGPTLRKPTSNQEEKITCGHAAAGRPVEA